MITIFASEIASLLDLDPFFKKRDTLLKIEKRYRNQNTYISKLFQNMTIVSEDNEITVHSLECDHKSVDKIKTFSRDLTTSIKIKGKFTLIDANTILVNKKRIKNINNGPFANELCQAKLYLWLLNSKNGVVQFIEETNKEQSISFIYYDPSFELIWNQMIVSIITEFFKSKNICI